jgi:protein subunit release factor B
MASDRENVKKVARAVLVTQGPAYAERLRERAIETSDPAERERLIGWAQTVERGATSPEKTVDALEALYELAFGEPKKKNSSKRSRRK